MNVIDEALINNAEKKISIKNKWKWEKIALKVVALRMLRERQANLAERSATG